MGWSLVVGELGATTSSPAATAASARRIAASRCKASRVRRWGIGKKPTERKAARSSYSTRALVFGCVSRTDPSTDAPAHRRRGSRLHTIRSSIGSRAPTCRRVACAHCSDMRTPGHGHGHGQGHGHSPGTDASGLGGLPPDLIGARSSSGGRESPGPWAADWRQPTADNVVLTGGGGVAVLGVCAGRRCARRERIRARRNIVCCPCSSVPFRAPVCPRCWSWCAHPAREVSTAESASRDEGCGPGVWFVGIAQATCRGVISAICFPATSSARSSS